MPDCSPGDCIDEPVKKGCEDYCFQLILRAATIEEKVLILGIRPETAQATYNIYNSFNVQDFADLAQRLTEAQVEEIKTRLRQSTPAQRAYFQLSRQQREGIIEAIRNLPR